MVLKNIQRRHVYLLFCSMMFVHDQLHASALQFKGPQTLGHSDQLSAFVPYQRHAPALPFKRPQAPQHSALPPAKRKNSDPHIAHGSAAVLLSTQQLKAKVMAEHQGKPYVCRYCQRRYSTEKALCLHERTHTRRFYCNYCYQGFTIATNARRHIKKQHPQKSLSSFFVGWLSPAVL